MTDTPMAVEINCETGEQIVRPFNAEEIQQREKDMAAFEVIEAERIALEQAKIDAKASALAKLAALGLTEEEAKAITG
jgi:hypothetical protein